MSAPPNAENGIEDCSCTLQVGEDGDVILLVGPKEHKIQVSSSFLKHISPVFRAMINAPMIEGEDFRNKLESSVPAEITLPEDDPRAMVQALRALYGTDPSAKLSPRDIKNIVLLADKYGFVERLKYFGHYWLVTPSTNAYYQKKCWDLAIAAYHLQNDQAFLDMTKNLVTNGGSLLAYAKNESNEHLGMQLGMAIEEVRNENRGSQVWLGVCLDCFVHNTDSFVQKGDLCKFPQHHRPDSMDTWGWAPNVPPPPSTDLDSWY